MLTRHRWTLQELLAPDNVVFLNANWLMLGDKVALSRSISEVTRIPVNALTSIRFLEGEMWCVAERMRWAAARNTTREEDAAYCMLGLFGVHMPLLYGEGATAAFHRLQIAIMQASEDQSLFAFESHDSEDDWLEVSSKRDQSLAKTKEQRRYVSALAYSPACFSRFSQLSKHTWERSPSHPFKVTNKGLEITLPLRRLRGKTDRYEAQLECANTVNELSKWTQERTIILLQHTAAYDNQFRRVNQSLRFTEQPVELGNTKPETLVPPGPFTFLETIPVLEILLDLLHLQPKWTLTTVYITIDIPVRRFIRRFKYSGELDLDANPRIGGYRGRLHPGRASLMYLSLVVRLLLIPLLTRSFDPLRRLKVLNIWFWLHLACDIILSSWRPDHKFQYRHWTGLGFICVDVFIAGRLIRLARNTWDESVTAIYTLILSATKYAILASRRPHRSGMPFFDWLDTFFFKLGHLLIVMQIWQDRAHWLELFRLLEARLAVVLGLIAATILVPYCFEVLRGRPQWK